MKKFLIAVCCSVGAVAILSAIGFAVWTEVKHDKSAYRYIKDEIQAHDDKQVDEEIKTENADGTVEATAVINF